MDDEPEFVLSRFINPHLLWIRTSKVDPEFVGFEHELNQHYNNNKNIKYDFCNPQVGDMVAFFDRSHRKWYRAIVDFFIDVPNSTNIIYLWLIDYGYSVKTVPNSVSTLERKFKTANSFGNILKVGVSNILPATEDYDFLNEQPVVEMADHWNESTMQQLQKIINSAYGVEFRERMQFDDHLFGDLVIHTNTGKVLDLRQLLAKSPNAVKIDDDNEFIENLKLIQTTTIDRYLENDRKCVQTPEKPQKRPSFDSSFTSSHSKKLSPAFVEAKPTFTSVSIVSRDTSTDDEPDVMPLLIPTSESDTAETASCSFKSDSSTVKSLSLAEKTKDGSESDTSTVTHSSTTSYIMPSCYDQILGQEARSNKSYQTKSSRDSKRSGMSRLDKLLAKRKGLKDQKVPENKGNQSSEVFSDKMSRISKLQATKTVEMGIHDQVQSRQNVKHRDDDESFRPFVDSPLVMVHGKHRTRPVYNHTDVPFTPEIFETLKKQMPRNEIRRLQAHVWPHIMHENSAIIVGKSGSGKTSTLIPAICSLVIRLSEDDQLPDTSGPAVIIVAAFSDNVSDITRKIKFQLNTWNDKREEDKKIIVESAYGRHREAEIEASLLNGVGILVVTPPCLQRMIDRNENVPVLTKSRLKIMVIEDFDVMHGHYGDILCNQIQYFYVKHSDGNPTQLMITSSQWEPKLLKYCKYGKNPALYIANYIEASVYGQAHFRLNFAKKDNKMVLLQQFLADDIYKVKRTMVICSDDQEVDKVCDFLRNLHVIYTAYTHNTEEAGKDHALSWHEKTDRHLSVFVCSDSVLGDLTKIKNVQRLLHFSLPDLWSTFSFRFSVFFNTYHDFLKKADPPKGYEPPFVQIVIDEDARNTLPRLTEFLERVDAKIPKEVHEASRQIMISREVERKSLDLCPYFLQYGMESSKCPRANCRGRHALQQSDKPTNRMPAARAFLKLKITCIHSPIHYSAQILGYHLPNERTWTLFENKDQNVADVELQMQLNLYFNNFTNLRQNSSIQKGDLCGWMEPGSVWRRIQITDTPKRHVSLDKPQKVNIRLIDTGVLYHDQAVTSLYELPEVLRRIPARAIDVHHIGCVPFDGDKYWGSRAKGSIDCQFSRFTKKKSQADESKGKDFYVKADVEFRLENHVWTKTLSLCEPMGAGNDQFQKYLIHKILMRNHFAQRDQELKQMQILKEMAEELGFMSNLEPIEDLGYSTGNTTSSLDTDNESLTCLKPIARSTWDYLDQSQLHPVVIYHFDNSQRFSLVRIDRVKKIDELCDFINKQISKNVDKLKNPEIGRNCLVPMDDDYVRGRIIEVTDNLSVFICDFGRIENYDIEEIFETTNEIVEFMPYTAIFGSLSGITDQNDVKIWEFIRESMKCGEIFAKVVALKRNLEWLPGIYFYDVVLLARDTDLNVKILNEEFVQKGFAKWIEGTDVQKMSKESFVKDLEAKLDEEEETPEENWESFVGTHKKTEVTPMPSEFESLAKISNELFGASKEQKIDFDDEEMIQMMKMFKLESYIPLYQSSKTAENSVKAIKTDKNLEESSNKEVIIINDPKDTLIHTTRQPEILWQQNNVMVVISIHLGDAQDYHLEIKKSRMIFAHFPPNVEPLLAVINFFGSIIPKLVSHQIRGLNLVIRLVKRFPGILWPTLTKEKDKFPNIKYKIDSMEALDDDFEPIQERYRPDNDEFDENHENESSSGDEIEDEDEEFDDLENPLFDGII